jgi:hypothetical protein
VFLSLELAGSISIAPSALDRDGDVSLGLTAQAMISSALRAFPKLSRSECGQVCYGFSVRWAPNRVDCVFAAREEGAR